LNFERGFPVPISTAPKSFRIASVRSVEQLLITITSSPSRSSVRKGLTQSAIFFASFLAGMSIETLPCRSGEPVSLRVGAYFNSDRERQVR